MNLLSAQLHAFEVISKTGSYSRAARELHISQPALSRRIKALEEGLSLTLFHRTSYGIELTEAGYRLLKFVQMSQSLEEELHFELSQSEKGRLGGVIKIGGYSSIIQPVVMPALAPFLREHPDVQVEFMVRETNELPELLYQAKADFIFTDAQVESAKLEEHRIGHEEFIAIESSKFTSRNKVYLDTSPADTTTERFFQKQANTQPKYRRSYMHDEMGILEGVILGLGRAIKPVHMLPKRAPIRRVPKFKPMKKNVYLYYRKTDLLYKTSETYHGRTHSKYKRASDGQITPPLSC